MNSVRRLLGINEIHDRGILGKGVVFAVIDTGVINHIDLQGRIINFIDMTNPDSKYRKIEFDDNGHGTHICGILAGSGVASKGKYKGICPESRIIVIKALDENGKGEENTVVRACRWVIDNRVNFGIDIVNLSFGSICKGKNCLFTPLVNAVEDMWEAGLFVVAAAGNNGPGESTVTSPGISSQIITVGALDDNRKIWLNGKMIKEYSGCGKEGDAYVKPDLLAPATMIVSCGINQTLGSANYSMKSGTSMAVPIICGVAGLVMCVNPNMTNNEIKALLKSNCIDRFLPKARQGAGLINPSMLFTKTFQ